MKLFSVLSYYVQYFAFKLRAVRSTFLYISIGFSLAAVAFYKKKTVRNHKILEKRGYSQHLIQNYSSNDSTTDKSMTTKKFINDRIESGIHIEHNTVFLCLLNYLPKQFLSIKL
jgi:hypothetical protein